MSYSKRALAAASALLVTAPAALAGNVTLQGNCVKIGTSDRGTIGSQGNTAPGILYDSTCTSTFNPSYDYLTPGTPFEGWTIKGLDATGAIIFNHSNNNASYGPSNPVTGTNVDYSGVSYRGVTFDNRAVWSGSTSNFNIEHDVRFNDAQHFVDINTRLEFLIAVPTLYFGRFTDPDARAAAGDSSATLNVRGYAGGIPATNVVLSEALASKYALGLFTGQIGGVNSGVSAGWTTDPVDYYNGVNDGDGDYTIGLGFMFTGLNTGDIVNVQYAYIFGPSAFAAGSGAVAGGAGGSTPSTFTVTDVGSASAPTTPSAPTVTGTSTVDTVTSSSASSTRTETSYVTRTVSSTDADGNPVLRTYTDTVLTTIPVTTTTTTTTPVTTTTWSDGTTTTSSGTPVVTTSASDGTGTSAITGTVLDATAVTRTITTSSSSNSTSTSTRAATRTVNDIDPDGNPRTRTYVDTILDTTPVTTVITTTTPVTTTYYANGTTTVSEGTSSSSRSSTNGSTSSSVISSSLDSAVITKTITTSADTSSNRTATRTETRTVSDIDSEGNPRTRTYTDTIVDTTLVTTTTTSATPVTTTYYPNGSTAVVSGTTVSTSSSVDGPTTSAVVSTSLDSATVTRTVTTAADTSSNRTETRTATRTITDTDSSGNPRTRTYTDTIVDTIPVTTTTISSTPVTTTYNLDGSTTVVSGATVSTSSSVDGTASSAVISTSLDATAITRQSVAHSSVQSTTLPVVNVTLTEHDASENKGVQKIARHHTTTTTTPMNKTVVTTPVITTSYADGSETVANGTPVTTYEFWNNVTISHAYDNLFGRVDQLQVLDGINDGINGLLNHEPSQTKERLRVFENNRFVQSYNGDGYSADSKIFGGGFEFDVTKGWTVGYQYNNVNIKLRGVDSNATQVKNVHGIFNTFHGNTFTLNTNAAIADSKYNYNRTVEGVFNNAGETKGNEWWVSNRLYMHVTKWLSPFVGYTVWNNQRKAYTETGSIQSARSVDATNNTSHVGEAGLKLETRFGGKKNNVFGVSVDGAYGTDNSYGVTATVDYKEILIVEASHGVNDGVTNNSIAGKVKFRF